MTRKHKLFAVILLAAPLGAAASPQKAPPDRSAPKELIDLRAKLLSTDREQAKKESERWSALCDADGYPLVGNIANKSNRYQPSEVCADLRKAAKK